MLFSKVAVFSPVSVVGPRCLLSIRDCYAFGAWGGVYRQMEKYEVIENMGNTIVGSGNWNGMYSKNLIKSRPHVNSTHVYHSFVSNDF